MEKKTFRAHPGPASPFLVIAAGWTSNQLGGGPLQGREGSGTIVCCDEKTFGGGGCTSLFGSRQNEMPGQHHVVRMEAVPGDEFSNHSLRRACKPGCNAKKISSPGFSFHVCTLPKPPVGDGGFPSQCQCKAGDSFHFCFVAAKNSTAFSFWSFKSQKIIAGAQI